MLLQKEFPQLKKTRLDNLSSHKAAQRITQNIEKAAAQQLRMMELGK